MSGQSLGHERVDKLHWVSLIRHRMILKRLIFGQQLGVEHCPWIDIDYVPTQLFLNNLKRQK
jgi:hypothetical protein